MDQISGAIFVVDAVEIGQHTQGIAARKGKRSKRCTDACHVADYLLYTEKVISKINSQAVFFVMSFFRLLQ